MQYTLHVTNDCNLACDYCNVKKGHTRMTFETASGVADRALREAMAAGKRSICLSFYGGEPLLEKDLIVSLVEYGAKISEGAGVRMTYRMTTNGVLLDQDFLAFAVEHKFKIALSIDGDCAVHNRHRKCCAGEGSFQTVCDAAQRLLAVLPDSYAMMTINPDTGPALARSVAFIYGLGFRKINTTPNFSVDWTGAELTVLREQYAYLAEWYAERLLAGEGIRLPLFDNKLLNHLAPEVLEDKCVPGKHGVSVSASGEIYPCIQFSYHAQLAIGNLVDGVDSTKLEHVRERAAILPAACQQCALRTRCDNQCGCRNLATTGYVNHVSPLFCAHERMLIPLADALGEAVLAAT